MKLYGLPLYDAWLVRLIGEHYGRVHYLVGFAAEAEDDSPQLVAIGDSHAAMITSMKNLGTKDRAPVAAAEALIFVFALAGVYGFIRAITVGGMPG